MGITALFTDPYYSGTAASSSEVPGRFGVAINGIGYVLDLGSNQMRYRSLELIRQQADSSDRPGEASLNPDDLWRRVQDSWHLGAGQRYVDRETSLPGRYDNSKGIDNWTRWQIGLHADTRRKRTSNATNLALVVVGSYLYVADGQKLYRTSDLSPEWPTWTEITGTPAAACTALTSDGYNIYAAFGASGIYQGNRDATSVSSWVTGTVTQLGYVKGRLMAANAASLYNITGSGALPGALLTHANTDWSWIGFAEGPGYIYAAGYSGDKSLIYRITVRQDGTALDAPQVAGELPDGEIVRSLRGYLGYLAVGTDKGWRLAEIAASGELLFGPLNSTASVRCFEPQDRFVWFGWSNYDTTSTGLGRADLSEFTDALAPAYASDLMAGHAAHAGGFAGASSATYASTPHTAITGDLDVRIYAAANDWTPTSGATLLGQGSTPKLNLNWSLALRSDGKLRFYYSTNGSSAVAKDSSAATGFTDGTPHWLRVVHDVDNGAAGNDVAFYTSEDGINWTQLGTTQTTAGTVTRHASTSTLAVGRTDQQAFFAGSVYYAEVRDGIAGTIVADPDFVNDADAGAVSLTDGTANVWTITAAGPLTAEAVQGTVRSVVTFADARVFAVEGSGVWVETSDRVPSGSIDTGMIGYGIADPKTAVDVTITTEPLTGSYVVALAPATGTYTGLGTQSTTGSTEYTIGAGERRSERFGLRLTLTSDGTDGPVIQRVGLRANPNVAANMAIVLPLLLHARVALGSGEDIYYDVRTEVNRLMTWHASRAILSVQIGEDSYAAVLSDFDWVPYQFDASNRWLDGTFVAQLKTV